MKLMGQNTNLIKEAIMLRYLAWLLFLVLFLSGAIAVANDAIQATGCAGRSEAISQKTTTDENPNPEVKAEDIMQGDCSDYTDLTGQPMPIVVTGTTADAYNDYGPYPSRPDSWDYQWYPGSGGGPDVTFKWVAPADTNYTISLCTDGNYDTGLEIYNFTCPDEPVYPNDFIRGNEDFCLALAKLRSIHFAQGQAILIVVDGFYISGYQYPSGEFTLEITMGGEEEPPEPECPTNGTIYGQPASCAFDYNPLFWTSDKNVGTGIIIYDDLPDIPLPSIWGVNFWGFDGYFSGNLIYECTENPSEFEVKFYEDNGSGYPGNAIWSDTIIPDITCLTDWYWSTLNHYHAQFHHSFQGFASWISIQGISYGGDPQDCAFIWLDSQDGNRWSWQYADGQWYGLSSSLSLCLLDSTATPIYENSPNLPAELSVSQNYPNPFNAQTTIHYTLPTASDVSIDIFEITGRRVEALVSGHQDAGEHEAIWNAGNQASGVYFYRLKAGEYSKSEKCILLK
jgi:hypothetical protein